jgi:hypothetical protein
MPERTTNDCQTETSVDKGTHAIPARAVTGLSLAVEELYMAAVVFAQGIVFKGRHTYCFVKFNEKSNGLLARR